jgi:hypothetical protein
MHALPFAGANVSATNGVTLPQTSDMPPNSAEIRSETSVEVRRVAELIPHPGLVKHALGYSTQELSTMSERGNAAFDDPITITHEDVIVQGYAIWQLAKLRRRATLSCIVRPMDLETALLHLLEKNRGSKGIGDFARILMALELEPWFSERAKSNQRLGGREKGSSHLAEADKLDVRIEVARAAGVSTGNVSKVKKILQTAIPDIRSALLAGEVRINRAATWAKDIPSRQSRLLYDYRNGQDIRRTINALLRKHEARHPRMCDGLREVQRGLQTLYDEPTLSSMMDAIRQAVVEIDHLLSRDEVKRAA